MGLEVALRKDATAEEYRADLAEALATTERLCRLTDDLLLLARLESDVAQPKTEKVDVLEMLHEIAEVWRASPGAKEPAIEVVGEGAPLLTEGRSGDLYRLFGNLVENAVYHGGGGHMSSAGRDSPIDSRSSVKDDGPGIDPRERERIFERFSIVRGRGAAAPASALASPARSPDGTAATSRWTELPGKARSSA